MIATRNTKVDQLIEETGCWVNSTPSESANLARALDYFLRNVPLDVLNRLDFSSPWGPQRGPRTQLLSWLQGIAMTRPVNSARVVNRNQRLKQFRNPGDSMNRRGFWFTWESTDVGRVALPAGQGAVRIFRARAPFPCMESTASDAFAGWAPASSVPFADYRRGGGTQLFIYSESSRLYNLELVGGAK